jgi:hypothetical protein
MQLNHVESDILLSPHNELAQALPRWEFLCFHSVRALDDVLNFHCVF